MWFFVYIFSRRVMKFNKMLKCYCFFFNFFNSKWFLINSFFEFFVHVSFSNDEMLSWVRSSDQFAGITKEAQTSFFDLWRKTSPAQQSKEKANVGMFGSRIINLSIPTLWYGSFFLWNSIECSSGMFYAYNFNIEHLTKLMLLRCDLFSAC